MYKRVTNLAGHTSRVAELVEQVQRLSAGDHSNTHRELYIRNVSSGSLEVPEDLPEPSRTTGDVIAFDRYAPGTGKACSFILFQEKVMAKDVHPGAASCILHQQHCCMRFPAHISDLPV